jgi:hypothetical protein
MRLIIIFISYVSSHPTCFGPLLAHHQGCPELLLCYHLVLAVLLTVRASVEVALSYDKATSTDSQQTRQEPNGNIATAQDTPDDGPIRARNM